MPILNKRTASRFDLNHLELRQNPGSAFSKILERGPVFQSRLPIMGTSWVATSWEAVSETLRNTQDFVRDPRIAGRKNQIWIQRILPRKFKRLFLNNMLTRDGQDHRRLRTLVSQAFQRQNINHMEKRIEAIAIQHLQGMESDLENPAGGIDFISGFCRPFPLAVICELLGLPESDRPKFMNWFSGMSRVRSATGILKLLPMMNRTLNYLEEQFALVRKHPRPGLITSLVEAEAEGERLQKDELLSTALLLLLAGHETTLHLLSNSLLTLLQLEDEKVALTRDWSQAPATIDEILRWTSVIHVAKPRFVNRDREFHGQRLSRGEIIIPCLGSANFDPQEFVEPTQFQRNRSPNRHMTFGSGPHVCLGMNLALTEARIALRAIFEKWPHLDIAFNLEKPDFGRRIGMRTLNTLLLNPNP